MKNYERLASKAIREKSRAAAVQALTLHPLVNSYSLACALTDATLPTTRLLRRLALKSEYKKAVDDSTAFFDHTGKVFDAPYGIILIHLQVRRKENGRGYPPTASKCHRLYGCAHKIPNHAGGSKPGRRIFLCAFGTTVQAVLGRYTKSISAAQKAVVCRLRDEK